MGYVYLVRHHNAPNLVKIGLTKHLDQRMRQLKNPEILATTEVEDEQALETLLHRRYKALGINLPQTEYFALTEDQITNLVHELCPPPEVIDLPVPEVVYDQPGWVTDLFPGLTDRKLGKPRDRFKAA